MRQGRRKPQAGPLTGLAQPSPPWAGPFPVTEEGKAMTCRQPRLFGLGMRKPHYRQFLERSVAVDFVEVISENFMVEGGRPLATITRVREHYPVALHGVSMSIGSFSGLDRDYLERLSELIRLVDPMIISDHLCWTGWSGFNSHDLLPLPYTDEALQVAAANTKMAQDRIGRQLIIENPSSYVTFDHSTMSEWQFLRELCAGTGCGLLLDVNNIAVSAANHGFDPIIYLEALADCDVRQMHLAGHDGSGSIRIDTHERLHSRQARRARVTSLVRGPVEYTP